MKYKVLFLDLDGTILNTLKDIAVAVNYSLKFHHLPIKSDEQIRTYLGHGSGHLIHRAMDGDFSEEFFQSTYDVYKNYYLNNYAVYTKPYDGVINVLEEFKAKGGKIALVTNKPQDIAIKLINKFFPNLFDSIRGQVKGINVKPDVAYVNLAMNDLGITNKKDILYVGDSLVDFDTANNAKLDVVLCNYGFATKQEIINTHANYIENFNELRGFLY